MAALKPLTPGQAAQRHRWWLPLAIIFVLPLIDHLPQLLGWVSCNPIYSYSSLVHAAPRQFFPGSCTIDGNDGTTLQALGGRAAELWLRGRVPWWNSLSGLGLPLAAEAQPPVFFLPFVLLLHFISGTVVLKILMQIMTGMFAFMLFQELDLGLAASLLGAGMFQLNGTFALYAHSHAALPIAFLPALLFGIERCRTNAEAGRSGGPAWIALAVAYSIVAGFPETAFMDGVLAALWTVVLVMLRVRPHCRLALCGKIFFGLVAGLALAAPGWISFIDYLGISSVGIHAVVPGSRLWSSQAITLLLPGLFGPPYADKALSQWGSDGGFFGPAVAVLAILACFSGSRHRSVRWAMASWIVFWLCVFLDVSPFHDLWASHRPLNEVLVSRYAMPSLELAAAILAALAVDDWGKSGKGVRAIWAALVFAALALWALCVAQAQRRLSIQGPYAAPFYGFALIEAQTALVVIVLLLSKPPSPRSMIALVAVAMLDASLHFMLPEMAGNLANKLDLAPIEFLRGRAGLSRVYAINDQLPSNYGSWFGIAHIQADSLPFANMWNVAATAIGGGINQDDPAVYGLSVQAQIDSFRAGLHGLQQAGVGYVVVGVANDPFVIKPEQSLRVVYDDARTRIYEISEVAPYFDARAASCVVQPVSREHVRTDCPAIASLVRRELLLPGWRAQVNGKKAAIDPGSAPGEGYFQQVKLPAGKADIRFRYVPPHADLMAALFGLGALATVGMAGYAWRKNHRLGSMPGARQQSSLPTPQT